MPTGIYKKSEEHILRISKSKNLSSKEKIYQPNGLSITKKKPKFKPVPTNCKDCQQEKLVRFQPFALCQIHRKKYYKGWQRDNPDKVRASQRKHRAKMKSEVFAHYSKGKNCCNCCGEKVLIFLTIDHINGDGKNDSKQRRNTIYAWLRREKFPEGFQVLCFNCNLGKHLSKKNICPHQNNIVSQK